MKKSWQIFWHILFWGSFITYFAYVAHRNTKISTEALLVIFGVYGSINIGLFYLNYLYLLPKYFDKKKYRLYTISLVLGVLLLGFIKYGIALVFKHDLLTHEDGKVISFGSYFVSTILTTFFFLFLSTALKFATDWFTNERIQNDLEKQRLTAELAFLKSQINPHFLFNSLNSIYSLAYQKSDTAPEAILKLSEIMRYMLYECNDNKVDLEKELQYLQNYIDLQKIRFGKKAFINFKIDGEVKDQKIVPLLLIPFVENAFKHGVANDPANPINILLSFNDHELHFYMENKKHLHNRDAIGGIGLQNVKRRLELLYHDKYKLNIKDEPGNYTCELSITL